MKKSDSIQRKFIQTKQIDGSVKIKTPDGYSKIKKIHKTIPYEVFRIELSDGLFLECADTHIIIDENNEEVFVCDSLGSRIQTEFGIQEVVSVKNLKIKESMYDIELYDGHLYYFNSILSHNTITVSSYFCWYIIFNKNKTAFILGNKDKTAREILYKIKIMFEHLPNWLKPGVIEWNKGSVEFENGSRIITAATSSSAIRGSSANIVLLDEVAFVGSSIWSDFIQSVYPTISSSKEAKIIMVSTPWGLNHFYKIWTDAVNNKNGYKHFNVKWDDIPGRDETWKNKMISEIGEKEFNQEFCAEFGSSSNTLINSDKLKNIPLIDPINRKLDDKFLVFKEPKKEHQYVLFCDVSEGVGGDYSTIQVIDVTKIPYKQIAVFKDNTIKTTTFASAINKIGLSYNFALVVVENNSIGESVLNSLNFDHEYDNLFFDKKKFGIKMTKGTKRIGSGHLKSLIETDKLIIKDLFTIEELSYFVKKSNGTFSAEKNKHDDLVTPLILFSFFICNDNYVDNWLDKPNSSSDIYSKAMDEIENNLLPVGFFPENMVKEEIELIYHL